MRSKMRRISIGLAAACMALLVSDLPAVVVAPTAVYLTDAQPSAAINLYNPSSVPEEVEVGAFFGYPATDADGNIYLEMGAGDADVRSAAGWVQALPRRLVVPPGERRVVRVLARPPAGTPDGEYWARVVLTSRGQTLPMSGIADSARVQVGLNLEVRTIIALTYRQGPIETGVSIERFAPQIVGDSLVVRPGFDRTAEGAFIGRVRVALEGPDGEPVRSWEEQIAVYGPYDRRYAFDVSDLPAGSYRAVLRLDTAREDVPEGHRLRFEPVEYVAEVSRP